MTDVNDRPSDIGQTVQPDLTIGRAPEGEDDRTDRRGEDAMRRAGDQPRETWTQQGQDPDDPTATLGGPATLDDANRPG
jgi:hypothetical protein